MGSSRKRRLEEGIAYLLHKIQAHAGTVRTIHPLLPHHPPIHGPTWKKALPALLTSIAVLRASFMRRPSSAAGTGQQGEGEER